MTTPEGGDERILVLAPYGRDAAIACDTFRRAGLTAERCDDIDALCRAAERGVGAIFFTQEALTATTAERLRGLVAGQPPWSDLPMIVLVSDRTAQQPGAPIRELLGEDANATVLERPMRAATLVGALQSALRSRRRQYELRGHLLAREQAEQAERVARAVAEHAVATRDEFLASVAHDLKNPLGAIRGRAQLLRRAATRLETSDARRVADGLAEIDALATSTVGQIDELLDLARLQAGQELELDPHPMDLVQLVTRVVSTQRSLSEHEIEVACEVAALPGVWDERRLERVLGNLLSNAIKYSPRGSVIRVRVGREAGASGHAVVSVQDEGIGIPGADLPRVFERFFRARNVAGSSGTGLGLSGVVQIVEQHHGTIAVESVEGDGSTFTVRLPL